ncbi:MAG: NAD(P)/FAD-dependent oxidoreductase [Bacteroidaceae bacterium]
MGGKGLRVAIIGGGAAGFFAAIRVKERLPMAMVDIYERGQKVLAKVAITGGGRCNLTNSFEHISDLKQVYPRGHQLMKRFFCRFNHQDTYRWFENEGVGLVTQEDECVFPRSQDAMSIVRCLTFKAKGLGIRIHVSHQLTDIGKEADTQPFILHFAGNEEAEADRVVITTGGSPRAEGLIYLERLGHKIEQPVPSLFTFNIEEKALNQLMGCVVDPVTVCIPATKHKAQGALLITHWGMSGPAILKLSSHAARHLHERQYREAICINWINENDRNLVEAEIKEIASLHPQKQVTSIRPFQLPARLWQYLTEKAGIAADRKWAEIGRKGTNRLIETLTNDCHQISGRGTYKEEFVTCGGISLKSIQANTLESKHMPGLFFAGEVLDIDAVTGGFNLQAAWTTGYIVGESINP